MDVKALRNHISLSSLNRELFRMAAAAITDSSKGLIRLADLRSAAICRRFESADMFRALQNN